MPQRAPIDAALPSAVGRVSIRTALPRDRAWIDHLSARFVLNVGYVPRNHRAMRIASFDYWLVTLDGEPAGFLLIGAGTRRPVRLSQIAIDADLWRRGLGQACVSVVRTYAAFQPMPGVEGDIAFGLPMEHVAASTAGVQTSSRLRVSLRGRRTGHWRWSPLDPVLVAGSPAAAAAAAVRACGRPLSRAELVAAASVNAIPPPAAAAAASAGLKLPACISGASPPAAAAAGEASPAGSQRLVDTPGRRLPARGWSPRGGLALARGGVDRVPAAATPLPPPAAAAPETAAAGGPCCVRAGADGPLVIRPRNAADGF